MASPNRRTWLLGDLARDVDYRLWFCERERRWEVEMLPPLVITGPWVDQDRDEPEPDQPAEWTPDGLGESEARPGRPGATPLPWSAPVTDRPVWLQPL